MKGGVHIQGHCPWAAYVLRTGDQMVGSHSSGRLSRSDIYSAVLTDLLVLSSDETNRRTRHKTFLSIELQVPRDEYAYRISNPKHRPKYTKAKVLHAQDKQHVS